MVLTGLVTRIIPKRHEKPFGLYVKTNKVTVEIAATDRKQYVVR